MATRTTKPKVIATVTLALIRETKGTFVFEAGDEEAAVSTLYVRKAALGETAPESITLTLV